ncbi:MAG TPA: YjbH domain-containing protein [Firmicutes bacterium]|nr:YjbH domain-containing protein [Bacillota bacterium]
MYHKYGKLSLLIVVVLMFGSISSTAIAHNVYGSTGLINIPTASVAPSGSLSAAYHLFGGDSHFSVVLGAFPGVEVGLVSRFDDSVPRFSGNVKVQILPEGEYPGISVGLTTDHDRSSVYIVGSMQLGLPGIRGHIGFGSGQFSRGFAGISSVLNPVTVVSNDRKISMPVTTVIVETDGWRINTGLSLKFSPELSAKVLVSGFKDFGFGVSYSHRF